MYELADPQVEGLLAAARQRGVSVRVLLDHAYSGASVNRAAYAQLLAEGVPVRWATDSVIFHQKTLTVDDTVSAVMTGNLTSVYYPTTRDFTVIDRNPSAVAAIESVFASDWNGSPVTGGPAVAGLVWSPGSESVLVDLIDTADSSIAVENEEMDSGAIETALETASRRGVDVELTMTADPEWNRALGALEAAGVRVATYPDVSGALYIHAKALVIDGRTAFVGSQNFSTSSLDDNRELGLFTTDPAVVGPVSTTLAADFAGAEPAG
jgi:phosphatidylserine/phosphatidylglycerophosphate/cardiolipin synthase-like enzyme